MDERMEVVIVGAGMAGLNPGAGAMEADHG
jgi:cation diffusion facilitator CzcD-associated flavoprotein CzcO